MYDMWSTFQDWQSISQHWGNTGPPGPQWLSIHMPPLSREHWLLTSMVLYDSVSSVVSIPSVECKTRGGKTLNCPLSLETTHQGWAYIRQTQQWTMENEWYAKQSSKVSQHWLVKAKNQHCLKALEYLKCEMYYDCMPENEEKHLNKYSN